MMFTPANTATALRSIYQPPIADDGSGNADIMERPNLWAESLLVWRRDLAMRQISISLADVAARQANWDGYGSAAPNEKAIQRAVTVIELFFSEAVNKRPEDFWASPFVGLNERGDVVFEWWNDEKKLSLYVSPDATDFVSSWGPHIEEQMDAGAAEPERFGDLWTWLRLKSV